MNRKIHTNQSAFLVKVRQLTKWNVAIFWDATNSVSICFLLSVQSKCKLIFSLRLNLPVYHDGFSRAGFSQRFKTGLLRMARMDSDETASALSGNDLVFNGCLLFLQNISSLCSETAMQYCCR